jgi:hypothetical protein
MPTEYDLEKSDSSWTRVPSYCHQNEISCTISQKPLLFVAWHLSVSGCIIILQEIPFSFQSPGSDYNHDKITIPSVKPNHAMFKKNRIAAGWCWLQSLKTDTSQKDFWKLPSHLKKIQVQDFFAYFFFKSLTSQEALVE